MIEHEKVKEDNIFNKESDNNIKIIYEKPKWRNIIFDGTD